MNLTDDPDDDDETCRCGYSVKPPTQGEWWWPNIDPEPGPEVRAVARHGLNPISRRFIRIPSGWVEIGWVQPPELTVLPWRELGLCWAGNCHPVIRTKVI